MARKNKISNKSNELLCELEKKLDWNLSRLKFLTFFILALCTVMTVSFTQIAKALDSKAKKESKVRRIQRFIADFEFDYLKWANFLVELMQIKPPFRLLMDRTNWQFGAFDINILMLSIAYKKISVPVLFILLDNKGGNSQTYERTLIVDKFIMLFGIESIKFIAADREFIGKEWIKYFQEKRIKFYFRIKSNAVVCKATKKKVKNWFSNLKFNEAKWLPKAQTIYGCRVYVCGLRKINERKKDKEDEYVILISLNLDYQALENYKVRWEIETMFKAFKTHGFNIEDTNLQEIDRVKKLIALVSLAFCWCYLIGALEMESGKLIPIRKHGRPQYTVFYFGLELLSEAIYQSDNKTVIKYIKFLSYT